MAFAMRAMDVALAEARESAALLREWGAHGQAAGAERALEIVERRFRQLMLEPVSLVDAAAESGYSADHLGRLVRAGTIPTAGLPNAPRIRRCDLPSRPGHGIPIDTLDSDSVMLRSQMARSVVTSS